MTSLPLATAPGRPLWRTAQLVGVMLTVALIVALYLLPVASLQLLWDMVIPLLPAVFLVNPMIWRNVCPLATLSDLNVGPARSRTLGANQLHSAWVMGVVLLFLLVPARRFLFNTSGAALAGVITAVAVLALWRGRRFERRAGFCNSICPVLPVEKLYGQAPMVPIRGVRCSSCTLCTTVGCLDLAQGKTVAQTIGPQRHDTGWLRTGFGVFAAAFPGFIAGYFTTPDGALGTAPAVYLRVFGLAVASYALAGAVVTALRIRAGLALPILGATSLALYYWYAAPNIATAYGMPDQGATVIQVVMALVLTWWLPRTLRRATPQRH